MSNYRILKDIFTIGAGFISIFAHKCLPDTGGGNYKDRR